MAEKRTVFLVSTGDEGYLGNRRYSYSKGTSRAKTKRGLQGARIFARRFDAESSLQEKSWRVVEAVLTVNTDA